MHRLDSLLQRACMAALTGILLVAVVSTSTATANLTQLRADYLEADRLLDQKKVSAWLRRKAKLKHYPLYHYLIIKEVHKTHSEYSNHQIDKIISRVDTPLPGYFSRWWLKRLNATRDWGLIVKYFANSKQTETRCIYALAMLRSQAREQAIEEIKPLWLVGRSQPKQCDPLFKRALNNGIIDDELIWQRMLLAQRRNQSGLVKYLNGLLDSGDIKQWGERLRRVHRNPQTTIQKYLSKWSQSPYGRDVITHGMAHLTRKSPDQAIAFWRKLESSHPSAVERLVLTQKNIAQILGWRRHKQAYRWLARLPKSVLDSSLLELMVRNALATENWSAVLKSIDRMTDEDANQTEWRYWRARALEATGQPKKAQSILATLAPQRNFYGMLAADQLNLPYQLSPTGLHFEDSVLHTFVESEPAMARIQEWLALDEPYSARRELTHLRVTRKGDSDFWIQAANLFHSWGWHDGAIWATFASGRASEFQKEITHPSPYINQIRTEADRNSVPQHWILSIMRQESLFVHDIRSGAGAVGLMQLLPSTARNVAKRNGLRRPSVHDLSNTSLNIRLGTTYFRRLLNRLDGNPVYSLAGYNAGPHRVDKWHDTFQVSDLAVWVEVVPFTETRNYIKKILVNFIIYENIHNVEHSRIRDYL